MLRTVPWWLGIACLLVLLPHAVVIDLPLLDGDDLVWIESARDAGWRGIPKLLSERHFIGFRPVTAMSYLLGSDFDAPRTAQLLDLSILAATLLAVAVVATSLLGVRPHWSLLLVALLGLHPVVEAVLPFPSRRADLLVTLFSVLYFGALLRGRGALRLLWFTLALGSKENAFVLLPAVLSMRFCERRMAGALRACAWELGVAAAMFGLRLWVLREVGGYEQDIRGEKILIPLDYLANVFLPHAPAYAMAGGIVLWIAVFAAAATTLGLMHRRRTPAQAFLLAALASEAALYWASGLMFPRLVFLGCALLVLWWAERLVNFGKGARIAVLLLGVPWCALYLISRPWERLARQGTLVADYTSSLRREIGAVESSRLWLYLADLPTGFLLQPLEQRPSLFYGSHWPETPATATWCMVRAPLVHRALMMRLAAAWKPECKVFTLPVLVLNYDDPNARHQVDWTEPTGELPATLHLTLYAASADIALVQRDAQVVPEGNGWHVFFPKGPKVGEAMIFLFRSGGGEIHSLPAELAIQLLDRAQ